MVDWIRDRLYEKSTFHGIAAVALGTAMFFLPVEPIACAIIGAGAWMIYNEE